MTPRPFRLLAYDFDGTLVDTKEDIAFSVNRVREELGLPPLPPERIFGFIGRGVTHLVTRSLEGSGFDDLEQAIRLFRKHYRKHLLDRTRFYPQGPEVLSHFADRRQAILSNKPVEFIERILERLGERHRFAAVVGGDSVENKKPHPEGLLRLMEDQGVTPPDVLLIGDSPIDIETGKNAGVATCGATWGLTPPETLRAAGPDYLIDSLDGLKRWVL